MQVTYLGHAAILLEAGGSRILMDPWLTDPTYHGTWWHFPPLALGVRDLPRIDYLYLSHEHPDHFDPPTLAQLDKNVHVIIANYRRKRFRDRIAALGFRQISELEFDAEFHCGSGGLRVRLIGPDRPWDDSAILLRHDRTTIMNVNDCHLDEGTLGRLGREHAIDLAFLTFTGASQYPGCFDFPISSKIERALYSKHAHLEEFVRWARLLRTKRAVPAAGNHALLTEDQLFLNTPMYANTPDDAIQRLRHDAPEIEGVQMNPGDTWTPASGHVRFRPAPDWSRRLEAIEGLSREVRARSAEYFAGEAPAPPDLYDQFVAYFTAQLARDPAIPAGINLCVWWTVTGAHGGEWVIDFRRPTDWVMRGVPADWNLHITIPDTLVYKGVSGEGVWDDIILSFRVRLARRPDRYMKEFWTWFCKL
jgi:L-ascorbate metabolism protein UlaG (beta-lactamase superfamily)